MKKKWLLACYIGSSILFGTGFSLRAQTSPETSGKPAYQDTNQSFEKRTKDLISLLSVEEKAMLLDHKGPELERLNILSDKWNQCLHGVVWNLPTTIFPIPTAIVKGLHGDDPKYLKLVSTLKHYAVYNVETHGFVVEPGVFEVQAGSSSEDIRLKGKFEVIKK